MDYCTYQSCKCCFQVTARFSVRANKDTGFFEYISCVIDDNHLVDDYNLIKSSARSYEGRSFIVEMQASTNGFVVLKVHEDPNKQLQCNNVSSHLNLQSMVFFSCGTLSFLTMFVFWMRHVSWPLVNHVNIAFIHRRVLDYDWRWNGSWSWKYQQLSYANVNEQLSEVGPSVLFSYFIYLTLLCASSVNISCNKTFCKLIFLKISVMKTHLRLPEVRLKPHPPCQATRSLIFDPHRNPNCELLFPTRTTRVKRLWWTPGRLSLEDIRFLHRRWHHQRIPMKRTKRHWYAGLPKTKEATVYR